MDVWGQFFWPYLDPKSMNDKKKNLTYSSSAKIQFPMLSDRERTNGNNSAKMIKI